MKALLLGSVLAIACIAAGSVMAQTEAPAVNATYARMIADNVLTRPVAVTTAAEYEGAQFRFRRLQPSDRQVACEIRTVYGEDNRTISFNIAQVEFAFPEAPVPEDLSYIDPAAYKPIAEFHCRENAECIATPDGPRVAVAFYSRQGFEAPTLTTAIASLQSTCGAPAARTP